MVMEQLGKDGEEHRKTKRLATAVTVLYTVRAPFPVRIRIGNSDCSAIAQDIGERGMGLLTSRDLPVDSLLGLKFTILNDHAFIKEEQRRSFELDAQVRNCLLVEKTTYRLGVFFASISEPDRAYIARFIKTNTLIPNTNV